MKNQGLLTIFLLMTSAAVEAQSYTLNGSWEDKPQWLDIQLNHRSQLEFLDGQFRSGRTGSDQAWLLRTDLLAGLKFSNLKINAELLDARMALADAGTSPGPALVNPLDVLQANVEFTFSDQFSKGSKSSFKAGRFTADLGSRRFIARQRHRNTIGSFTGMLYDWSKSNRRLLAIYSLPVVTYYAGLPTENDLKRDREYTNERFWALYSTFSNLPNSNQAEFFLMGLDEEDSPAHANRNRELYSLGFRILRAPTVSKWDYELETLFQQGSVRASSAAIDTRTLDQQGWFVFFSAGYTFQSAWQPRLAFEYDQGSGDDNPADGRSSSFEPLFGVPRPDLGPTNIFGPFQFGNLVSPGLRLRLRPLQGLNLNIVLRDFSLDNAHGGWSRAGYAASAANTDTHLGTQLETRLQYSIPRSIFSLDMGTAYLKAGEYLQNRGKGDSRFLFVGLTFSI